MPTGDIIDTQAHARARIVALTGSLLGVVTVLTPGYVTYRPNRILDGTPATAWDSLGPGAGLLIGLWAVVAVTAVTPIPARIKGLVVGLLAGAVPISSAWLVGRLADDYLARQGEVARLSLGLSWWVSLLATYLVVFAATAWLTGWRRILIQLVPIVGVAGLLFSGQLSSLSVMREYQINSAEFAAQLNQQLIYVIGATLAGIIIGLPLGILAARRRRTEPVIFTVLNVLQVIPVLAFIGLLNPVLAWLSAAWPALANIGVRPVGWAPVMIVLTAYALYPITRNTYTAITSLDPASVDAAKGIGMGSLRRLIDVELPLAAPTIVAGIRIAVVQATAGAIIAGLVGGGGLGTFVFLGASQAAPDLILLGALPIVALALLFDRVTLGIHTLLTAQKVPA